MKLWMFIMAGWFIYRIFNPKQEIITEPQLNAKKKRRTKKHTMLPTYYVPAGTTPHRRTVKPLRISEKATVKQKGMFPEQFINNNTTETDYEEVR